MTPKSTPAVAAASACELLRSNFSGRVITSNDPQYEIQKNHPWCQNCWLPATCFVQPSDTHDVADALKIVRKTGVKFAVRSGGHNFNPGFSSLGKYGVLLDLKGLKLLHIGDDGVLQVGAGNTWGDVYSFLEDRGLSAIGGRQSDVGISGYLLGGGMTAFPNLHGIAVDNIKNYEVVLADSTIINANAINNVDLYRALKGGGTNFGIVTRFDIQTYPLINAQYTVLVYNPSGFKEVLRATTEAQEAMEIDPKIGMFTSVNPTFIAVGVFYADTGVEQPQAIKTFFDLKSLMTTAVPTRKGTVKSLVEAIGLLAPPTRRLTSTLTTKVSYKLYEDVHKLWLRTKEKCSEIGNLWYNIQPASTTFVQIGEDRGGNSLGLEKAAQTWWSLVAEWPNESDDVAAARGLQIFTQDAIRLAKEHDQHLDFLFMNDAEFSQNVLVSYGADNVKKLQEAAAKYDPEGIFQQLQNDGFLLRNL
ncbi:6-hydroxy-D-nicotine oxidase [Jackrogersella minutella]|nr:6-hydroxy-D-nicotine oxidase [Jackrogersella minutella]